MNNITTGYNPFLQEVKRTNSKLININKNTSVSSNSIKDDTFTYTGNEETKALRQDFEKIKSQQGIIGKTWDGIKNLFGMKSGSKKVEEVIKQAEKGEITTEEAKDRINKYEEGQKTCVDVAADMASGIIAVGAFALAVPTGGASLAVGLAAATAAGAGVKIGIKAGDAIETGKEYNKKDLLYDFATGAVNGLFAPITNGIGASLTKTIGKKLGVKVVQEGAKEVAGQGIKQAAKSVILTQSVDVIGGTIGQRALALGAGMAVDGALGGASDNMVRAALNGENVVKAGIQGAVGGAIAAPVIGGGFRIAGKAGHALNNKITTKIVLPDGINTKFKQGQTGDCALLSTIDGMMNNPSTAKTLKKSITKTTFGDYNVKIGDEIVRVSKSSLTDEMLSDTTGIRIFEQAYKQISGDIDGGFAETIAKQFGLNPVHITNDAITDEMLDKIAKEQNNTVLSLGTLIDTDGNISSNGAQRHYFTIKDIDADTKTVKITSPYDTSKTIELSYDDVKTLGISIDGGSLSGTDLPNVVRNADDIRFKGAYADNLMSDNATSSIAAISEKRFADAASYNDLDFGDRLDLKFQLLQERIDIDSDEIDLSLILDIAQKDYSAEEFNKLLQCLDDGYSIQDARCYSSLDNNTADKLISIKKCDDLEELAELGKSIATIDDLNSRAMLEDNLNRRQQYIKNKNSSVNEAVSDKEVVYMLENFLNAKKNSNNELEFSLSEDYIKKMGYDSNSYDDNIITKLSKPLTETDIYSIKKLLNVCNGKYKNALQENPEDFISLYRLFEEDIDVFILEFSEQQWDGIFDSLKYKYNLKDISAILQYKGMDYQSINHACSFMNSDYAYSEAGMTVNNLTDILNSNYTDNTLVVHRGEGTDIFQQVILPNGEKLSDAMDRQIKSPNKNEIDKIIQYISQGKITVKQPRFMSTTFAYGPYSDMPLYWTLEVPKNTKGMFINVRPYSTFEKEYEFLIQRNSETLIKGIYFDYTNNTWKVNGKVATK